MDKNQIRWNEILGERVVAALTRRHFEASYTASAAQAAEEVLAMIPAGATVARCGSTSTAEIGLWEKMALLPAISVIDHNEPGISKEEVQRRRRLALMADVMIASANALTHDGRIVNLDGVGNRVAALSFGPTKVILVVGINKLAPDLDTAMARVKHYAAPLNVQRTGVKTPCAETGVCSDCASPQRICNIWSVIEGQSPVNAGRIHVKIVGESLGY